MKERMKNLTWIRWWGVKRGI